MKTILIVGLGNPGAKYKKTRHNAGFMFADYFFEKFRGEFGFSDWEFKKNLNSEISVGKINTQKQKTKFCKLSAYANFLQDILPARSVNCRIIFAKPQTFMNLSGEAVSKALKFYKLKVKDLIVIHDDIDLALGKYKISLGSRAAGHNGVQNIIDMIGTKNFTRIRLGVDNRSNKIIPTDKYVLGKFAREEMKKISEIFTEISDELIK